MLNIKTKAQSKPHNTHWLNRYFRFIELCQNQNNVIIPSYSEKHHILPKTKELFPEYKDFKENPWNKAVLTYRQHCIAHYMLMKAYPSFISMAMSVSMTYGQIHAKHLKPMNSRFVESSKTKQSDMRRGVFTRGYDKDGKPLVSEETKKILSKKKIEYYSNPLNRELQSKACKGIKRSDETKARMRIAALNRPPASKESLAKGVETRRSRNHKFMSGSLGIYVTPIGNFEAVAHTPYNRYCLCADKIISIHHIKSNKMLNKSTIGLTFRELGFYLIPISDKIKVKELYETLGLVHPPEPNHPLSLELNDYLLQRKSLS